MGLGSPWEVARVSRKPLMPTTALWERHAGPTRRGRGSNYVRWHATLSRLDTHTLLSRRERCLCLRAEVADAALAAEESDNASRPIAGQLLQQRDRVRHLRLHARLLHVGHLGDHSAAEGVDHVHHVLGSDSRHLVDRLGRDAH